MSFNPLSEVKYRYRLATEYLEDAERQFFLRNWAGVVSSSQLAVENFAKSVIAIFEVPTWSHDPSNQLSNLIERLPSDLLEEVKELATMARELAPEHGRSTYGEPNAGLTPRNIYKENHASNALKNAKKAETIVKKVFSRLDIKF